MFLFLQLSLKRMQLDIKLRQRSNMAGTSAISCFRFETCFLYWRKGLHLNSLNVVKYFLLFWASSFLINRDVMRQNTDKIYVHWTFVGLSKSALKILKIK